MAASIGNHSPASFAKKRKKVPGSAPQFDSLVRLRNPRIAMSFLVGDDDDHTVVAEALAFIDSYGAEEQVTGSIASSGDGGPDKNPTTSGPSGNVGGKTRRPSQSKATPKKRRVKTFASSSTRQLQRKKAEASSLREQALVLQAQLDLLKRAKHSALTGPRGAPNRASHDSDGAATSEWYTKAVTEFVERQQAEKNNRQLKSILSSQEQVCEALRAVLLRRTVLDGMDLVFGGSSPLYQPPSASDYSAGLMHILEERVESLYIDSKAGIRWDQPCLISSSMNVKHNTQYGKIIEIETVTPMPCCSLKEATALLWKDLKTIHEIPDKRYRYLRGSKPNSLEKNFVMKLRGQHSDMEINGSHFSRKFAEPHRVVIAKADSIVLSTQGLEFHSPSWTEITPAGSDLQHGSVVRNYVRIYAEVQPNLNARPEDVEFARSFVLNGLSKMMFGCAQKTQSELVQETLVI